MKRRKVAILAVAGCLLLALLISRSSKSERPRENSVKTVPTSISPSVMGITNIPTETPIDPAVSTIKFTCVSVQKDILSLATAFYRAHQEKDATTVLGMIAPPYSQEEQNQLDFWIGTDNEGTPRLYLTSETNYTVTSYKLGAIVDRGQDFDERGSKRCQIPVSEERSDTTTIPYSTRAVTHYLDFSVDISGYTILSAYRDSKDGGKYSGFGD